MAPDVLARAFEPFFTTKATGEGTGLGLATVYGIVQQSDGEVQIESTEGQGTTVTVVLRGAAPASAPRGQDPMAAPGGQERILLVEDEAALRIGTQRLLVESGYAVVVATNGLEALAAFDGEVEGFALVLTDVAMPGMRGDELARHLGERAPDLPVIFMSGYDSGARVPLDRLLEKPVAEDVLLRAIRELLDG
jgi:CheY-like chemotaxis protein